jgi:2-(1,2-epoxy-1,2-dihydrophenyl)acetyl-CoA isomerase
MTTTHIHTERDGAVGVITIDRRERFNSLDVTTARDLRKAGLSMARDRAVRAVVLRGSNGIFCSGADLKYIRAGGDPADLGYLKPQDGAPAKATPGQVFKQILEYLHSTISEIRRAPKPFIAAVDGVAAAGGLGLAICCDLVIASERATFEWAYGKTALTGAESTTFLLPRLLGLRRALDLALLNPRLDARAAHAMGLVSLVLPTDGFDDAVRAEARRLAEGPTASLAVTKSLFNEAVGMDALDAHLDRELTHLARAADGPDVAEGLDAFFARRPPKFGGL